MMKNRLTPLMAVAACLGVCLFSGASFAQQAAPPNTEQEKAGSPQTQPGESPKPTITPGVVTNVFIDTDIRVAVSESAAQAGVTVIMDDSIKAQNISIEFKDTPVAEAMNRLALFGNYVWKLRSESVYLMSSGKPDAALFSEFAETRRYITQNYTAESIMALLPEALKAYVQSDRPTNTLTISAPSQRIDGILKEIKRIDAPVRQIVVEALVTELDATASAEFGFSWNWKKFGGDTDLSLAYTSVPSSDIATLKAIIGKGKATLRANPRLCAPEGREATFSVGQETYFPIITSGNSVYQTAQVQMIKTGVLLRFTGLVGDDGLITLILTPEVSDAFQTIASAPTTNVRKVSTTVRLKPGESFAIGGLVQELQKLNHSKVPILGDLPIVGALFTSQSNSKRKVETIIIVTPYLTEKGAGIEGLDSKKAIVEPTIHVPGVDTSGSSSRKRDDVPMG